MEPATVGSAGRHEGHGAGPSTSQATVSRWPMQNPQLREMHNSPRIFRKSVQRNSTHGYQLDESDKKEDAKKLWRVLTNVDDAERYKELQELFSVGRSMIEKWTKDARAEEKKEKQNRACDLWLECWSLRDIAKEILGDEEKFKTVDNWVCKKRNESANYTPPKSQQHFDVWSFGKADTSAGSNIFGRMPAQIVENLLSLYTEPGAIIIDPFAGSGTTIDVAKRMGRRIWASDLTPFTPNLPIHEHAAQCSSPSHRRSARPGGLPSRKCYRPAACP